MFIRFTLGGGGGQLQRGILLILLQKIESKASTFLELSINNNLLSKSAFITFHLIGCANIRISDTSSRTAWI